MPDCIDEIFIEFDRRERIRIIEEGVKEKDKNCFVFLIDSPAQDYRQTIDNLEKLPMDQFIDYLNLCKEKTAVLIQIAQKELFNFNRKSLFFRLFNKCRAANELKIYKEHEKQIDKFIKTAQRNKNKTAYIERILINQFKNLEECYDFYFPKVNNGIYR